MEGGEGGRRVLACPKVLPLRKELYRDAPSPP